MNEPSAVHQLPLPNQLRRIMFAEALLDVHNPELLVRFLPTHYKLAMGPVCLEGVKRFALVTENLIAPLFFA